MNPRRYAIPALALIAATAWAQFPYRIESPLARDDFRTGVNAYNAGRYAESLLLFEQALSGGPGDPLAIFWLGKAYYRMGLAATAAEMWRSALAAAGTAPFAESRIGFAEGLLDPVGSADSGGFVRIAELAGTDGDAVRFLRPSWVEPLPDGSFVLVAHGSNKVLRMDANGRQVSEFNAGSTGFDRPFSCVTLPDGSMVVSEFQSDRLARLDSTGHVVAYIGDAAGPGRLSGPQYLAVDPDGFFYVTDAGSARVLKFAPDGSFVLAFGRRTPAFAGLVLPTGIAARDGLLYVADQGLRAIAVFDGYGNYVRTMLEGSLERPEGLSNASGTLLLADGRRVMAVDPATGAATVLYVAESRAARFLGAASDANGDLLAVDFDSSELLFLSRPAERYAGLLVEVIRVNADAFPRVVVDVSVRNRSGEPVTGLGEANFYLSERIRTVERRVEGDKPVDYVFESSHPAPEAAFLGSLDGSDLLDVVVLAESSPAMSGLVREAREVLASIHAAVDRRAGSGGNVRLVMAGAVPEPAVGASLRDMNAVLAALVPSSRWRFDAGLRLAVDELAPADGRRAVVFITTGGVNEAELDGPALSELADLMVNNGVSFNAIVVGRASPVADAVAYLVERTGGAVYSASRPEGLGGVIDVVMAIPTGTYRLSFVSGTDDGFGQAFLQFAVETYLRGRSGREETGYFAPLR